MFTISILFQLYNMKELLSIDQKYQNIFTKFENYYQLDGWYLDATQHHSLTEIFKTLGVPALSIQVNTSCGILLYTSIGCFNE